MAEVRSKRNFFLAQILSDSVKNFFFFSVKRYKSSDCFEYSRPRILSCYLPLPDLGERFSGCSRSFTGNFIYASYTL